MHFRQKLAQKIEICVNLCCSHRFDDDVMYSCSMFGAIPNFATEKEPKRNFLDFTDVTLVIVDIKSERFIKRTVYSRTCLI